MPITPLGDYGIVITELHALIVDRRAEKIEALQATLKNEFQEVTSECVASMHRALECQRTTQFQVCFISDQFPLQDLSGFFRDMRSIGKDKSCVFIQLRDKIAPSQDRAALKTTGFVTMITPEGSPEDRTALRNAMHELLHARELKSRVENLEEVTKVTLKELDRLAMDRKRGFFRRVPPGYRSLIESHSNFEASLLLSYFETLEKQTQSADPIRISSIDVPERVLKRKLPNLERSRYFGASHRVWEKLKRRHGKRDSENEQPNPAPALSKPDEPPG